MIEKQSTKQPDNSMSIASMVLGIVSFTGPGLLTGIPAIVLAIIALRRQSDGKGMSIAGLVTGIVSTVLSLLFILFFVFLFVTGAASNWDNYDDQPYPDAPYHSRDLRT